MTDLNSIIASLSDAEREALQRHRPGFEYGSREVGWPDSAHAETSFCKAGRVLMDKGLIRWAGKRYSSTTLTPNGEQVRAALQGPGK